MNGYELANQFRRVRRKFCFSSIEADLFYELVAICNDEGWPDTFQYPNALLCATIGTSEKSLISARNRLQQAGLLNFISGHKRFPTKYSFLPLPEVSKKGSKNGSENGSTSGSTTGRNTSDSNKTKIETKLKEGNADAGASPPEEKEPSPPKGKTSKKEKPPSCAPPPTDPEGASHQEFVDAFYKFYEERTGMPPRLFEADYAALKKIRKYLVGSSKSGDSQAALQSWLYILKHWAKLEDFLQRQLKPTQIDSNMVNILAQLRTSHQSVSKNGRNQGNNFNPSRQAAGESLEEIESRYS